MLDDSAQRAAEKRLRDARTYRFVMLVVGIAALVTPLVHINGTALAPVFLGMAIGYSVVIARMKRRLSPPAAER